MLLTLDHQMPISVTKSMTKSMTKSKTKLRPINNNYDSWLQKKFINKLFNMSIDQYDELPDIVKNKYSYSKITSNVFYLDFLFIELITSTNNKCISPDMILSFREFAYVCSETKYNNYYPKNNSTTRLNLSNANDWDQYMFNIDTVDALQLDIIDRILETYKLVEKFMRGEMLIFNPHLLNNITFNKFALWVLSNNDVINKMYTINNK